MCPRVSIWTPYLRQFIFVSFLTLQNAVVVPFLTSGTTKSAPERLIACLALLGLPDNAKSIPGASHIDQTEALLTGLIFPRLVFCTIFGFLVAGYLYISCMDNPICDRNDSSQESHLNLATPSDTLGALHLDK
ncbi:hypothetical protein APICC_05631 [Apis cerana cerana]|uniref:Uncharacterized protein n=1 Tax=Apis cerana cerana TaxID=94128 RepID=A0A2A3E178_APICC|nr:hypothetical protein APICC_05631 [Apis cerana cerana]